MFVACSTLSFGRHPLERALRIIGELEFSKVDVAIHEEGPHLRPSEVAADVNLAAHRIRIGPSLSPAAFSVEIAAADPKEFNRQLLAICQLARVSAVTVLTLSAAAVGTSVEAEVERLTTLVNLTHKEGIVFTVATKTGTLTETPEGAVELCKKVPNLGLTLDPSHYISGPHQGKNYDVVLPYVRHVHLRDTGRAAGQFQVRVGQGEIEYGRLVTHLSRRRYDRLLSVQIHDVADAPFNMEQEVRKLKYLLEA